MTTKYYYNVKINTNNLHSENVSKIIISNLFEGEIDEKQKDKIEVLHSGSSVWRYFVRNIPENIKNGDLDPLNTSIVLQKMKKKAPILVLTNLKYKGNVGCIIRTVVQSNLFESVIIINDDGNKFSKNDIMYYSASNAPLIPISYSKTTDFIKQLDSTRKIISIHISPSALNIYDKKSINRLQNDNTYIIMGAEDKGIPEEIQSISDTHCQIPSFSSCINVSSAFATVNAIMNIARN
jgi:tRNA G18 (ribose-2'-O)-methylase SpoU